MAGTSETKRKQIMTGAEKLLGARRFHEITMDDVARMAGVGKGTIYRYFRDKDALFAQVATSGCDELHDLIRGLDPGRSVRDRLEQACKLIGDFFGARRQLFRMMQTEEARLAAGTKRIRKRQTQFPRRGRRHHGTRRSGILRGAEGGGVEGVECVA